MTDNSGINSHGSGPLQTHPTNSVSGLQPLTLEAAAKPARTSIEALPNELLSHILSFLDLRNPSSSDSVLREEPSFEITSSENATLKACSAISKRWREATIPLLFRHAQFTVEEPKSRRPILTDLIQPFYEFVRNNQLGRSIETFVLLVHNKQIASKEGEDRFSDFSAFWNPLFDIIDPKKLLIVAPAEALASLTACHTYLEDDWSFDCPCHYLRLEMPGSPTVPIVELFSFDGNGPGITFRRSSTNSTNGEASDSASSSTHSEPRPRRAPSRTSALFEARPWAKLLLNEGSFIRAYANHEYWLRQPPSVSSNQNLYRPD